MMADTLDKVVAAITVEDVLSGCDTGVQRVLKYENKQNVKNSFIYRNVHENFDFGTKLLSNSKLLENFYQLPHMSINHN